MVLTADYHTHTVFSHGKGTIQDNAEIAKSLGLKQVGITDHGFSHPAFGLRNSKLPKMRKLCDDASKQLGIDVLLGIESNLVCESGKTDLKEKNYDYFDIYLAGIHKFIMYKPKTVFTVGLPSVFYSTLNFEKVPGRLIKSTTKALVNTVKNNPVDVITHLNFCSYSDPVEVAKVCADYGTYLEISSKKVHLTDEEIIKILDTGVNFVISSDAHLPSRVGEVKLATECIKRLNIPLERIHNINGKIPDFRFKKFKEKSL